jgi:hypothetical protein
MRLTRFVFLFAALAACSDGPSQPDTAGPPAALVASGAAARGAAGTPVTAKIAVRDANGRGVPNQTVSFAVVTGGGSLAGTTATSDANGEVTLPAWTLGKTASTQLVRATLGTLSLDVPATVATSFDIDVRFFGDPMTAEQQALFTNAAARISAVIVGDIINVGVGTAIDLSTFCGAGLPTVPAGQIDDVVIYAAVQNIDGPGKILAQAGPCLARDTVTAPQPQWRLPAVGIMNFDAADIANLSAGNRLQDVITHEMLHVIGVGTVWRTRNFLVDAGLETVNFSGQQARAGCVQSGGSAPCALNVPVENTGGQGTRDGHWRESVFDSELMTGFAESSGPMPFSQLTVGSLADLGYTVNPAAADAYVVPGTAAMAARTMTASGPAGYDALVYAGAEISTNGRVRKLDREATARVP